MRSPKAPPCALFVSLRWLGIMVSFALSSTQYTHAQNKPIQQNTHPTAQNKPIPQNTHPTAQIDNEPTPPRHRVEMGAQVDFSRDPRAAFGAGVRVGYQYRMLAQIHLGAWLHWTYHGIAHEARAAVGLHLLLDILPVMPFLQLSFGLQTRFAQAGVALTPDVHAALGVELPLTKRWRLGAAFHLYLPTAPESFPTTQSLLLHATWVW